jgi:hypothetical protein
MTDRDSMVLAELQRRYDAKRSIDELLNFLGALELAFSSGVLQEVPPNVRRLTEELTETDVRNRQKELGLWLPDLLQERWSGISTITIDPNVGMELFNNFLWIDALIRNEPAVRIFLAMVDPRLDLSTRLSPNVMQEFRAIVSSSERLGMDDWTQIRSRAVANAINGFSEFLDFCIELDGFLQSCANFPEVQKRYFGFYAPYFGEDNKPTLKGTKSILEEVIRRSEISPEQILIEAEPDAAQLALDAITRFVRGDYLRTREVAR